MPISFVDAFRETVNSVRKNFPEVTLMNLYYDDYFYVKHDTGISVKHIRKEFKWEQLYTKNHM